jgi:hypothetical protein
MLAVIEEARQGNHYGKAQSDNHRVHDKTAAQLMARDGACHGEQRARAEDGK